MPMQGCQTTVWWRPRTPWPSVTMTSLSPRTITAVHSPSERSLHLCFLASSAEL